MNNVKLSIRKGLLLFFIAIGYLFNNTAVAQEQEVVQLTGIVIADDGNTELPGVHVYVPEYGRGTTTNAYGYFSMPALVGDHVVLSSVGFVKQDFIVPQGKNGRVNVMFMLKTDTLYLDNIDITPYLSEKMFKQAILAMNVPGERESRTIGTKLSGNTLNEMVRNTPYDAGLNSTYYFNQQLYYMQDNYGPRSNPFLNPFNWAKFINSLNKDK